MFPVSFKLITLAARRGLPSLVLALSVGQSQAQTPRPLSLDEALGIAQANAPALNAAARGAVAAREMAVANGQLPDPVLRLGVDNLPTGGPDQWSLTRDFMTMRRIGVMQEYVPADKRQLLRRRAELEAVRMEAGQRGLLANLRRDVAVAWFDRVFAQRSRVLLDTLEAEFDLQLKTLDSQVRAGKATPSEVPMAKAALLQTHDRRLVVDKQEQTARIVLARWLGADAERELGVAPDIERPPWRPDNPRAVDMVPAVLEHASERELVQADLAIAEATKRPNWTWEVTYSQRGSVYSNMLSFGVSIPLTFNASNRQDREIAARQAQVAQAHAQHEDVVRETRAAMAGAYAEWNSLVDRQRRLSDALLPIARQRIDLAMAAYRSGQSNLGAVLEARRAEVEAQLQLLDLQRETARVWAQLQYTYTQGVEP
jgi:outer membrane protein TolC